MTVSAMEKINTGVRSGVLREERFLFSAGWWSGKLPGYAASPKGLGELG